MADQIIKEKQQYINGVDNLGSWMGKTDQSSGNHIFYYYAHKLTTVRTGPWKCHFCTKEDYYPNMIPGSVPQVFNIRIDPYESFDSKDF